ncbi:hybrid sensor histidine kinase/response regulator [Treponema bryantii]|uniref:hybrid sensor histidine kinase/response regulator n=1 Tax=Treponema bryantii TaxID=163 RepID=UPI0003B77087|nr:response regulator [Treponema bryantii]
MPQVSNDITESYVSEVKELLESAQKDIISLKSNEDDSETLNRLLRNLHTIKGNSRMLGYTTVEKLAHAIEDIYKSVKDKKIKNTDRLIKLVFAVTEKIHGCVSCISRRGTDKQDVELYLQYCDKLAAGELIDVDAFIKEINKKNGILMEEDDEDLDENISDIQSIRIKLSRVNEIISDFDTMITREFHLKSQLDELKKLEEKLGSRELAKIRKSFENDIYSLETSIFSVQEKAFDLRMLPISIVLRPLENTIALEAMNLNKKVKCEIPDTDIALDKVILEELGDILMHIIRNALDHGIESPAERKKAKKSEEGTISITCVREARYIELKISDDGRGLDYDKIREKAISLYPERTEEIKGMSDRELSQFLFQSGFSTKENVTALSGRGVGLDVVWSNVEKIKGRIKIESEAGKGTSFILHFPLSLSTLQGLFVYSNKEKYLIPAQHIVDIIYRKKSDYITLQNQNYIRFEDQLVPCFPLSTLFEDRKSGLAQDEEPILIAEYMEQRIGIIVEQVEQYVSLVVKPMPEGIRNCSILQGIVFDEHYDIVPILHVPDILQRFKSLRGYDIKKFEAATQKKNIRILIVDDSSTTREIERSILEGAGYVVEDAFDGLDGLEKAKEKYYDLILADQEMPRMTGLVLLDNLRRLDQYKETPVIVVSTDQSRQTIEEFQRLKAGAIIAKSEFKRGNLLEAIKELLGDE